MSVEMNASRTAIARDRRSRIEYGGHREENRQGQHPYSLTPEVRCCQCLVGFADFLGVDDGHGRHMNDVVDLAAAL